jgi:hypothetical protein
MKLEFLNASYVCLHAELGPWHLVAVLNGGGEVSPPSTHGSMKLLGHK